MEFNSIYKEYGFNKIEEKYQIFFEDRELLIKAFVHASFVSENNLNYQRLEFLGDSVLDIIISDYIYRNMPDKTEGDMSKFRAKIVSEVALAHLIRREGLDQYILLGKSILNDVEEYADSYVADVFESLVAAIYLDQGFVVAKKFVYDLIIPSFEQLISLENITDYKTRLQEILQVNGPINIKYVTVKNDAGFVSEVMLEGTKIGNGLGKAKKIAEQKAAKNAIEKMS